MSQSRNLRRNSLSQASLAGGRRSRFGLAGSLVLHAAVIAATLFTWQHRLEIADESPPVVPVDLVTIGEKTNIAPVAPKEDFKPPKEQTAVAAPQVNQATPPPDEMAAPDVEMAPPPPEQASSEPLVEAAPATPVPKLRPKPPAHRAKKRKFDVNNILALLNKKEPSARAPRNARTGPRARRGIGDRNAMTMDLVDALRNQIAPCWSPPVGAPHPEDLIVSFEVFLNPDGSVARPPQLTAQSQAGGPYIRAAVEAGRRAIYTCAPYRLPADRYSQWRDITLVFDPRKMVGQ
jgi:hypothetical protein